MKKLLSALIHPLCATVAMLCACSNAGPAPAVTPSLRETYGIKPPTELDSKQTALLLVDYQNEFLTGKLPIGGAAKAVGQAVVLRDWARQSGIAVVYVKNVAAKADAPLFAPGSRNTEIAAELSPADGEEVIIKSMAGAFSGTDLNVKLRAKGIRTIIVGGIMTHLAVDTSARDGTVLGYRVIVASDACATRALHGIEGDEVVDDRTVHSVALAALADRFADVMPVGRIVRLGVKGGEVGK